MLKKTINISFLTVSRTANKAPIWLKAVTAGTAAGTALSGAELLS